MTHTFGEREWEGHLNNYKGCHGYVDSPCTHYFSWRRNGWNLLYYHLHGYEVHQCEREWEGHLNNYKGCHGSVSATGEMGGTLFNMVVMVMK